MVDLTTELHIDQFKLPTFISSLDMLVAVRCCPQLSWTNLVEMHANFKLDTSNVALQRSRMASELEEIVKKKTIDELRSYAETNAAFKQSYVQSMQPVIELLNGRFFE